MFGRWSELVVGARRADEPTFGPGVCDLSSAVVSAGAPARWATAAFNGSFQDAIPTTKFSAVSRGLACNENNGCYLEQEKWAIVRIVFGLHRYDNRVRTVATQQDIEYCSRS